jgi:Fe-S-cluster containining protein
MRLLPADLALVQIVDAHLADAAQRAGPMLACRMGCTQCCHGAFPINMLDALRLRAGLAELHSSDPLIAETVERRTRAWIREHSERFPGDLETGLLAAGDESDGFEDFSADAVCPALDPATGRCDVYAWRPMTCRVFGPPVRSVGETGDEGLGHCELCFIGASPEQVAACEMQVPHELEEKLLEEVTREIGAGETVVAFALVHRSFDAASDDSLNESHR